MNDINCIDMYPHGLSIEDRMGFKTDQIEHYLDVTFTSDAGKFTFINFINDLIVGAPAKLKLKSL